MNKWPGAPFWVSLHPTGAQNKTLILNTDFMCNVSNDLRKRVLTSYFYLMA